MTPEEILMALTGRSELTPEELALFRSPLSPRTQSRISSEYFSPYAERLDLGESPPIGSLGDVRSMKNYIQEILKTQVE